MKKRNINLFKYFIFVSAIFMAFSPITYAQTLKKDEIYNAIYNKIDSEIKNELQNYSNDYKITILGSINHDIITNQANLLKIEITNPNPTNTFHPIETRKVTIKDNSNNIIKTFLVSIKTEVYDEVLTAAKTIPYNQKITLNNTKLEKKEISKYLGKTLKSLDNEIIAATNYQIGSVILKSQNPKNIQNIENIKNTQKDIIISKNSDIDIVFESKGINIKLRGKALKDGAIGDTILVRAQNYNKTYNAKVKSSNEVIVRI